MIPRNALGRWPAAIAAAFVLLFAAAPARPDAMTSQDGALQQAASAAADSPPAPIRPEPQRSSPLPAEAAGAWGEAGAPLQSHAANASYGMPMPWGEEHFEAIRKEYQSPDGRKWLAAIMDRAKPFLPYIEERIRYYGLPDELAFLPVIESEFSPRDVSRSGAAGLWQFMRNSIGGYGMKIDDWVDERRDFMKSTDGAMRKLADQEPIRPVLKAAQHYRRCE